MAYTQKVVFETDSLKTLEEALHALVPLVYSNRQAPDSYHQLYVSDKAKGYFDDGKEFVGPKTMSASDPKGWSKPKYMHICAIGNVKSDMEKNDRQHFSFSTLVQDAMDCARDADKEEFLKRCGDGHTGGFNHFDGTVKPGYRISLRHETSSDVVDVSMCHMYYGK